MQVSSIGRGTRPQSMCLNSFLSSGTRTDIRWARAPKAQVWGGTKWPMPPKIFKLETQNRQFELGALYQCQIVKFVGPGPVNTRVSLKGIF